MPHSVSIAIGEGESCTNLSATFEDDEWDCLIRFLDYVGQLQQTKICSEGAPGKISVSYKAGEGWSYTSNLPPDDDFIALLHRLRPFILVNESTSFFKVSKILSRRMESDEFRDFLKTIKHLFIGRRLQDMVSISSNDVVINSESTLMKWLNAHEYHKDRDKQKELEELHKIFPLESSRAIFVVMVFDKVKAIFELAGLVATLAGKQESYRCLVP